MTLATRARWNDAELDALTLEERIADEVVREQVRREAKRRVGAEERGPQPPIEILTLRERLAQPRSATRWRIESLLPVLSRLMLAAAFKAGKTTLIANLIRCLLDGGLFLERYAVTPIAGAIALLDTEMSKGQLTEWLGAQQIRNDERLIVIPLRGTVSRLDLLDIGCRREWAERLKVLGVEYLILDCLRPVLDALGLEESRDAGRFLVTFDALLAEAGIPEACLIQHMGHTAERARGDSRLRDYPDVEWRLVRQDDDPASCRYLSAFGRDVHEPEQQLAYDVSTRRLSVAGGSRQDARVESALGSVLAILEASEPLSVRRILAQLADSEHPDHAIRAAIKAGRESGSIVTTAGPRGAILHRLPEHSGQIGTSENTPGNLPEVSDRVERVALCQQRVSHGEGECVSVSIERHAHTHTVSDAVSLIQPTQSVPSIAADPWRDLPRPPGSAEAAAVAVQLARESAARTDRRRARRSA